MLSRRSLLQASIAVTTGATTALSARPAEAAASGALTALNPTLSGSARTKGALRVAYDFQDPDGDAEGATRLRWLSAASAQGPWTALTGVTTVDAGGTAGAPALTEPALVEAVDENPGTDWFHDAKYGLSHHFISNYSNRVALTEDERWHDGESWDDFLATFAVDAYAADIALTGAGFVILTVGHSSGCLLGPNSAYERIAGLAPGERTPKERDLPREIAEALAPYGVRLILCVPANPPFSAHRTDGDYAITDAFGFPGHGTDAVPTQESMGKWQEVIREYSEHYGTLAAGRWTDGVYPWQQGPYAMTNTYNWSTLAAALKAGHPERIITTNRGPGADIHAPNSPYDESRRASPTTSARCPPLAAGPTPRAAPSGSTAPSSARTTLTGRAGATTARRRRPAPSSAGSRRPPTSAAPSGMDTRVNRFGRLDPDRLAQLRLVRATVREGAPTPLQTPYDDTDPVLTCSGGWAGLGGRPGDINGNVHYAEADGASVELAFTGTGVEFETERFTDLGPVEVLIDGKLAAPANCLGPAPKVTQYVAYRAQALTAGAHTIKVVKRGGQYAVLDAFRVIA